MADSNDEQRDDEKQDPESAGGRGKSEGEFQRGQKHSHHSDDDTLTEGSRSDASSSTSAVPWSVNARSTSRLSGSDDDDRPGVPIVRLESYMPNRSPRPKSSGQEKGTKTNGRSRGLLRWARTLPGFLLLCATLVSAAATVYFGAFYHRPGHLRASLDFAYLSPDFIDTKNSGLQLTIYNGTSSTQVVTDVRVDAETYTPLPYAIENRGGTNFRIENRPVSVAIPAGGEEVLIFRTSTVAALQPYKLDIDLASGTEVAVNVDPFIYLLRCAVNGTPADSCFVSGQVLRRGQTLQPYLASQAGLVALTVGPEPKVPKACRNKRVMLPEDPCIASLLRQAVFFPIGLHEDEKWSGPFPPPEKK